VATYVQRDVRQVLQVSDLGSFTTFLRLAAARTGQAENRSSLGADAGVTHNTVRAWLSVLETSFVLFRIPPWLRSLRKRVVKASKMHFVDSGLACHLLGIRTPEQLRLHPLRGAIFESWVASEVLKRQLHAARPADLFHLREDRGLEVDLIVEAAERVYGVDVKSAETLVPDFFGGLQSFVDRVSHELPHIEPVARLVFGGDRRETRSGVEVIAWTDVAEVGW
jgi:uncharacterized protein